MSNPLTLTYDVTSNLMTCTFNPGQGFDPPSIYTFEVSPDQNVWTTVQSGSSNTCSYTPSGVEFAQCYGGGYNPPKIPPPKSNIIQL